MNNHFGRAFGSIQGKINYNGLAGIGFRLTSLVVFVSLIVLFNIWYCSRNRQKVAARKEDLTQKETPLHFNKTKKWILALAGIFLLVSFLAQVPIAEKKLGKVAEKIPPQITNEVEGEDQHEKLGKIEKIKVTRVKEENEKNWGVFGKWEEQAIDCWLIIGGIIICLLAKQSIMGNLMTSIQSAVPLLLVYIFAAVPAAIIKKSGMSGKLAGILLPKTAKSAGSSFALLSVFGISFLLTFIVSSIAIAVALVAAFAPILLAFGESTLIYAAIFAWVGAVIGMAFSPNNGVLRASLEKGKVTYKQFIKKTWKLAVIMALVALGLVVFWTRFMVKG